MTPMVFILTLVGVCYVSELLVRFIVWLDGADECGEEFLRCDKLFDIRAR